MARTIVRYHVPGAALPPQPGVRFARSMSEAEVRRRALADPDNPPIEPKDFHKFKRVNLCTKSKAGGPV